MNILLDAMGGDNAPDANITGAVNSLKNPVVLRDFLFKITLIVVLVY